MKGQYADFARRQAATDADLEKLTWLLKDAAQTLRAMRATGCFPAGYKSNMPDVVHDFMDAYGWEAATVTRAQPTNADIDRMDAVLPWFQYVMQPRHRKILMAHVLGLSLRRIGREVGESHEKMRYLIDHAKRNILRGIKKDLTKCAVFDSLCAGLDQCA